jgi:hypothetical protein
MNYAKPEVILLSTALDAIQGSPPGSKMGGPSDHVVQTTANAYEADE